MILRCCKILNQYKILPFKKEDNNHIIFATNQGTVRKNSIDDFQDLRKNGKIYMKLEDTPEKIKVIDVVAPHAPIVK